MVSRGVRRVSTIADALCLARVALRIEFRTRAALAAAALLGGIVLLLGALAAGPDAGRLRALAPGLVALATAFVAVAVGDRLDRIDHEQDAFSALWLLVDDRRALFLGRTVALAVLVMGLQVVLWALASALLDVSVAAALSIIVVAAILTAVAASAAAVLAVTLSTRTIHQTLLLPVVLLPLLVPTLLASMGADDAALGGRPGDALAPLALTGIQAALFVGLGLLTYEAGAAPE